MLLPESAYATHGLAGNITYRYLGNNQYEVLLTTYTNPCAAGVDRCNVQLTVWSRIGVTEILVTTLNLTRENGVVGACNEGGTAPRGERLRFYTGGCIQRNLYRTTPLQPLQLPAQGCFEIRYADFARVNGVVNISGSGSVAWYASTTICNITGGVAGGPNSSPVLLNDPVDIACVNKVWSHNPGGFDPDGDSIAFRLECSRDWQPPDVPAPVCAPGYRFPNEVGGTPATNQFTVNPLTGVVTWNTPKVPGIYNFALATDEYRGGVLIGTVVRDIAIQVENCTNDPPIIAALDQACIQAGQSLTYPVRVRDPNPGDSLYFYLNNGDATLGVRPPFNGVSPAATLNPPAVFNPGNRPILTGLQPVLPNPVNPSFFPIASTFNWSNIPCGAVAIRDFQVDYYAHDNLNRAIPSPSIVTGPPLATNRTTNIRVYAPGINTLSGAVLAGRSIQLNWGPPLCTANLTAFEVYRSLDVASINPQCCGDSLTIGGYTRIATVAAGANSYTDLNLPFRGRYVYRIVAVYEEPGVTGQRVRSCPSNEQPFFFDLEEPVILNADVTATSTTAGSIYLRWRMANLNPLFSPPPYTYIIQISPGIGTNNFTDLVGQPTLNVNDTFLVVNNLNTVARGYTFRVLVRDGSGVDVPSVPASSIFLQTRSLNRAAEVRWNFSVPWVNSQYEILRAPTSAGPFTPLTTVAVSDINQNSYTYIDNGLARGQQVCYRVVSTGSYRTANIPEVLVNGSNNNCTTVVDTIPPCFTEFITTISSSISCDPYEARFTFQAPPDSCSSGVDYYEVFYKRFITDDDASARSIRQVPATRPSVTFSYIDVVTQSPVGCYAIEAVDSVGTRINRSRRTAFQCLTDDCSRFQLPNVFTPNGDGVNDLFTPITRAPFNTKGIRSLITYIYDRTGSLLYTSRDKNVLWDGTAGGANAPVGAYFYHVEVTFESLTNDDKQVRTGIINLLR